MGLDGWHEELGRALVPVDVAPHGGGPFEGRITVGRVGFLRVAAVEADAHRAVRTARHIARGAADRVAVVVPAAGTAVLDQDGRRAAAGPGGLLVHDTARPYVLDHPERFTGHVVHLPRRALGLPDAAVRRMAGTAVGAADGFGAALAPFLSALVASADSYSPVLADRLSAHVADLVATLAADSDRRAAAERPGGRGPLVRRIREHIDRNLADPALTPEAIARAHHISVRYLHRLFEAEDTTVRRLVRRRRLEECARALARGGRDAPTVSSIAQRWGFANPAHFSRAFRETYGLSPREWRASA